MFGILAEDRSDFNSLKEIVRRLAGDRSLPIHGNGFGGSGELLRKGRGQVELMRKQGCERFITCSDADGPDPWPIYGSVAEKVVRPAGIANEACVVVPVQEIEAWILADIEAVTNVITGWRPDPVANPESIDSPKEHLIRLSRSSNKRPRYVPSVHNEKVAEHLRLDVVRQKCPSFVPLAEFIAKA